MCEDIHLKAVLDPKLAEKDPFIAKTLGEARSELLKMLEIVLLDKYSDALDADEKAIHKQRLASLTTPKGMDRDEIKHQ